MSGGLGRDLGGGLCKYMDEMGSVCYDKAQASIYPMILHYGDEDGNMKVFSFVGLSGIMAYPVCSIFAFLKAMMLELHQTMPLLNTIHVGQAPLKRETSLRYLKNDVSAELKENCISSEMVMIGK